MRVRPSAKRWRLRRRSFRWRSVRLSRYRRRSPPTRERPVDPRAGWALPSRAPPRTSTSPPVRRTRCRRSPGGLGPRTRACRARGRPTGAAPPAGPHGPDRHGSLELRHDHEPRAFGHDVEDRLARARDLAAREHPHPVDLSGKSPVGRRRVRRPCGTRAERADSRSCVRSGPEPGCSAPCRLPGGRGRHRAAVPTSRPARRARSAADPQSGARAPPGGLGRLPSPAPDRSGRRRSGDGRRSTRSHPAP